MASKKEVEEKVLKTVEQIENIKDDSRKMFQTVSWFLPVTLLERREKKSIEGIT